MIKTNGLKQSAAQIEKLRRLELEQLKTDQGFMRLAIAQARVAMELGEVPVGAVIVKDGQVVATGYNRKETDDCAVCHAEVNAIIAASKKLGWRLDGCQLYVTLEPCAMCGGAVISSRISRVVFGATEPKSGAFGGGFDLNELSGLNHSVEVSGGVLESECEQLIVEFFQNKRK